MGVTSPGLPATGSERDEEGAACAVHPEEAAAAICDRCGAFVCKACLAFLEGKPFCETCRSRSDVDYTLGLKEKFWGKRDGYVWFFGIFGSLGNLANLILGGMIVLEQPLVGGLTILSAGFSVTVFVAYLLLKPWSRVGLFGVLAANFMVSAIGAPEGEAMGPGFGLGMALGQGIFPLIFFLSAYKSARNQLAFRMEVPREKLVKMYRTYFDNQLARAGFILSVFSLLVPGLALLSGVLCVVGLRRVDPESTPPIGRKKTAIAGIVFSILGLVTTGTLLVLGSMR